MSWSPDPNALSALQEILAGTLSPIGSDRQLASSRLHQAKEIPDFNNYLVYILVSDGFTANSQIRASAGITLKNYSHKDFLIRNNDYLLSTIIHGLISTDTLVRNITGTVITTLFAQLGVRGWPSLLPELINISETGSQVSREGATGALAKICEDSGHILNAEYDGTRPLDVMVPKFLEFLGNEQSAKVRANSLNALNHIIDLRTQSFYAHIDTFLQRLFVLASDQDKSVHRNVCAAFISVLETRPDTLVPHLEGVIQFVLHSITSTNDNEIELEACEFLFTLAGSDEVPSSLVEPHLPAIIPVLLNSMTYSEVELLVLGSSDDADEEDRYEDIRPTNAKGKSIHSSKSSKQGNTNDDDAEDSDDDDDDDEDDDDGFATEWSLRKCSAATLDLLTTSLAAQVLTIALPLLKEKITSDVWPTREAAILAFGAIAEGGIEFAAQQLPELVPFLVDRLSDDEFAVRGITCWTLSRYGSWICSEAHTGGAYAGYFAPTFGAILQCCVDRTKTVQESACSAVARFIDSADAELIAPVATQLIEAFNLCFGMYKKKNMVILYDAVQTLVDNVQLTDEQFSLLLPSLVQKWESLNDEDVELWSLMECFSSVAAAMGENFAPFAIQVYQRATRILAGCIELDRIAVTDPNAYTREKDFMITSLDLIDGLCQGLAEHSGEVIDHSMVDLVLESSKDTNDDVRQSAFALLGDLAIYIPDKLAPRIEELVTAILQEVITRTFESFSACNNACWALGEMALRLDMRPYCERTIPIIVDLLNTQGLMDTVLENAAVAIGRLGISCAEFVGPHLEEFALQWAATVMYMEENDEKETACQGMCAVIMTDPEALLRLGDGHALVTFVDVISMYATPGQELAESFQKLLLGYKEVLGDQWIPFLNRVSGGQEMAQRYSV